MKQTSHSGWISYGNGTFLPSLELSIPVLDDFFGVIRGIRVFTTTVIVNGSFFHLTDHIKRVVGGAKRLSISLPQSHEEIAQICKECLKQSRDAGQNSEGSMCLIISAGDGKSSGKLYVLLKDAVSFEERLYKKGAQIASYVFKRYLPLVKLTHYLGGYMAKEAMGPNFDFPFFVTPEGKVLEGDTFNLFFVSGKKIITPAISDGILDGITRRLVCQLIQKDLAYTLEERSVHQDEIPSMDEAFLTSSLRQVMPIATMDTHHFVAPGLLSTKIRKTLLDYYENYPIKGQTLL